VSTDLLISTKRTRHVTHEDILPVQLPPYKAALTTMGEGVASTVWRAGLRWDITTDKLGNPLFVLVCYDIQKGWEERHPTINESLDKVEERFQIGFQRTPVRTLTTYMWYILGEGDEQIKLL